VGPRPDGGRDADAGPRQGSERAGRHAGTADSLWRNAELIREHGAELLVVLSADAVYKLDYRDVVEAHLQAADDGDDAGPAEDAARYGVVQVGADGEVALVGRGAELPAGVAVPAGGRWPEDEQVSE
jgi:glucose-1-phosphate adenylyltransferase